ncbi:TilS substrate-binding domain-containing protein, partial [Rhizobium hidalgonense]
PDYIDDPANFLENFDRVFLRQKIWPLLNARWPSMDNSIGRTATLMQDCADILNDVLHLDWQRCVEQSDAHTTNSSVIHLAELTKLSMARQRLLLSRWMQGKEQYAPTFHLVAQLRDQLIAARQDANPKIVWQHWQ